MLRALFLRGIMYLFPVVTSVFCLWKRNSINAPASARFA